MSQPLGSCVAPVSSDYASVCAAVIGGPAKRRVMAEIHHPCCSCNLARRWKLNAAMRQCSYVHAPRSGIIVTVHLKESGESVRGREQVDLSDLADIQCQGQH